ncbi:hypothetical protein BD410DRAFT_847317 [Rickenella mellea]|uniref:Uncharacterized protein n=1 Tax=Rickenella mellea TaxID=50990 RepID=A0A4Y7PFJ2_9AGAM|nr:hypothetical protein BD410DRAFT_847317 [Rickenella mellea]
MPSAVDHAADDLPKQRCTACKKTMALTDFPIKAGSTSAALAAPARTKTCQPCATRKKEWCAAQANKENVASGSQLEEEDEGGDDSGKGLSEMSLEDFLSMLGWQDDAVELEARVNVAKLKDIPERRKRADKLAELAWEVMNYRYM